MRFIFSTILVTIIFSNAAFADQPTMDKIMERMVAANKAGIFKDPGKNNLPGRPPFPMLKEMPPSMGKLFPSAINSNAVKWVDLRHFDSPIRNQGDRGTCLDFSLIAAMENLYRNAMSIDPNVDSMDLSEEHFWRLYTKGLSPDPWIVAMKSFVALEVDWPYNPKEEPKEAPKDIDDKGVLRVTTHQGADTDVDVLFKILSKGYPVTIGITWDGFETAEGFPGVVKRGILDPGIVHALEVVGIIKNPDIAGGGAIITKNSWGTKWGDEGYYYFAFNHCFRKEKLVCGIGTIDGLETRKGELLSAKHKGKVGP